MIGTIGGIYPVSYPGYNNVKNISFRGTFGSNKVCLLCYGSNKRNIIWYRKYFMVGNFYFVAQWKFSSRFFVRTLLCKKFFSISFSKNGSFDPSILSS